jgi:hypothetical protein
MLGSLFLYGLSGVLVQFLLFYLGMIVSLVTSSSILLGFLANIFVGLLVIFLFTLALLFIIYALSFAVLTASGLIVEFGKCLLKSFDCFAGFIFQVILSLLAQPFIFFPSLCFSLALLGLVAKGFSLIQCLPVHGFISLNR